MEEKKELAECYREDIRNQSLEELIYGRYVGEVTLNYGEMQDGGVLRLNFYIGEHHENLLNFFKERNVYFTLPNDNLEVIQIELYNPYEINETIDHPFWKGQEQVMVEPEQIEELIPIMIPEEYGYYGYDREFFLSGNMIVKNKTTGAQKEVYCYIFESDVPEYVR